MRLVAPAFVTLSIFGATVAAAAPADDVRLADAAMKRDTATVRTLVDRKVDVNAPGRDGTPALHWLVRVDDLETARLLIRAGADTRRADRYGVTPLYLACANGNAAMIQLLLEVGADRQQQRFPGTVGEVRLQDIEPLVLHRHRPLQPSIEPVAEPGSPAPQHQSP